jgi:hypothetical protein
VDVVKVAWDMILSLKRLCKLVKNLSMVHNCGALYQSFLQKIISSLTMELILLGFLEIKGQNK